MASMSSVAMDTLDVKIASQDWHCVQYAGNDLYQKAKFLKKFYILHKEKITFFKKIFNFMVQKWYFLTKIKGSLKFFTNPERQSTKIYVLFNSNPSTLWFTTNLMPAVQFILLLLLFRCQLHQKQFRTFATQESLDLLLEQDGDFISTEKITSVIKCPRCSFVPTESPIYQCCDGLCFLSENYW